MPDYIAIGAGVGTLTAATLLAQAGRHVVVLDRNPEPGGAARTLELTLPGFKHEFGATNMGLFAGSPFYQSQKAALDKKGIRFIQTKHPFGVALNDGRYLGITTDHDKNLERIAAFSPSDASAWQQWRADFDVLAPTLFKLFGSLAPRSTPFSYVFAQPSNLPDAAQAALRGILIDSLRENLSRRFNSEALQALIASWGMHLDYAPDITGGCWMPFLETNADERFGIPIVQGGSGKLLQALAELVIDSGGEVRQQQSAERIVIEHNKATGVELESGEIIRCSRGVIAGITPTALLQMTGNHLPAAQAKRARNWRYAIGTMVIHLALSARPNWQAVEARDAFYVNIAPSLDYLATVYQHCMAGLLPAAPFSVIAQPTVYDPSRAPAGKHVLWIMVRGVPSQIRGDAAGQIPAKHWTDQVKQAFANRVLDTVEQVAPGLRQRILAQTVMSPLDLEQMNPNLVGGDINAGSQHLSQFYGQRPFPEYPHYAMPIDGLYLCGASTWPGGGVNPTSGMLLAQKLMENVA